MDEKLNKRIERLVGSSDVFLFMKGTPDFPQCGFSGTVVQVLQHLGTPFGSFDVLSDMDVRQGIKEYANWPTIPQLYVKGKFIGGCDIVREMFANNELKPMLDEALAG